MKKSILILLSLVAFSSYAQEVASFGQEITNDGAIPSTDLIDAIGDQDSLTIKVKGTINEVCRAKGCWMTMDLGDDQTIRVTFKDYGFFIPTNSSGKHAIIEGVVKKEIIEVESLKHYARDAEKSDEEIALIIAPEMSVVFVADGVLITE